MTTDFICTNNGTENVLEFEKLLDVIHTVQPSFEGPVHTTNLSNFVQIMRSGYIACRAFLEENHKRFEDVADGEVISKTREGIKEKVRFYYYYSTPTNYRANYTDPIIIVCDETIMAENGVLFSSGNAMSKNSIVTSSKRIASQFDWKTIFSRGSICGDYWQRYDVVRKRNAEFLYPEAVPISEIKRIYFPSEEVLRKAILEVGYILRNFECVIDRTKFGR